MHSTPSGWAAAPPVMRDYARRHGLEPVAFRSDGGVTITFDDRYRVQVRPLGEGRQGLSSLLLDLGAEPPARVDELLARLARYAAGALRSDASGLALDASGQLLVLQQSLPPAIDLPRFEIELAEFVNALAFWTRTAAQEFAQN